ncbi:YARHG domain-containing protein [Methylobacterium sp. ARG-1]|uniref:YARHG domain-containing protein n=1 Tax=Methylobacterium sp. ARG-1 TaxID=1692501 RepID=UPI00068207F0|nr:YARHG domain-containing protein [Methylobacterium sp. ARG-1]KNY23487.1 hypothetical protein AKJ13_06785 [Methylobacterium sp. ARG-1]
MRASLLVLTLIAGTTGAMSDDCAEGWYQRNLIYERAGSCFRSKRAIRNFGNTDCRYDTTDRVPLSRQEQAAGAGLQAFEQAHACPL